MVISVIGRNPTCAVGHSGGWQESGLCVDSHLGGRQESGLCVDSHLGVGRNQG